MAMIRKVTLYSLMGSLPPFWPVSMAMRTNSQSLKETGILRLGSGTALCPERMCSQRSMKRVLGCKGGSTGRSGFVLPPGFAVLRRDCLCRRQDERGGELAPDHVEAAQCGRASGGSGSL